MSVHRADCQNYLNSKARGDDEGRWINVGWGSVISELYNTSLSILARDRSGLIMDVVTVLNSIKLDVTSLTARSIEDGKAIANITISVKNRGQLLNAMNRLSAISGVIEVKRAGG